MHSMELSRRRRPHKLVENCVNFGGPDSELSIYDTYHAASRVGLDADQLLYCGMVTGRKIMHDAHHDKEQLFLPHESFVMAPGEYVEIDFPDATLKTPTTCLTVEISKEKVKMISARLSDLFPVESGPESWQYDTQILHTTHTAATQDLLKRMVSFFTENHSDRDMMIDLGVTELVVRLLRQKERGVLLNYCRKNPDSSGITAVLNYMEQHLSDPMEIEQLAQLACMSRSRLYVQFKKQLGCSPSEFQQQLRLKAAAERLKQGEIITTVCYALGFSDPSHFSRRFRLFFGNSPREYQNSAMALKGKRERSENSRSNP